MINPEFIHLRCKTSYSLLLSTVKMGALLDAVVLNNFPSVAITDSNNLFGAFEFSKYAADKGIQPVIGCSVNIKNPFSKEDLIDEIALFVVNEKGFDNIRKLISKLFLRKYEDENKYVLWEELEEHKEGLILLTGGMKGPVNRLFLMGREEEAKEYFVKLNDMFNGNIYVELQRHGFQEERKSEPFMISLAYEHNVPLVATNNVVFIDTSYFEAHEAMLCIKDKTVLDNQDREKSNLNFYFKSAKEMKELFKDIPEALENTVKIAKRTHYKINRIGPVLPKISEDEPQQLRKQAREGLERRILKHKVATTKEDYFKRLEYELDVIISMKFAGYFLIVADFIQWSHDNDVPVGPGRGSGAGSMVAWALRITDIDPIRFGLLFERFLNPERVSMPDFDVDFCKDGREETIKYVCDKYGHDKVAQIITYGQMKAKAVVRDVGRVLNMSYGAVDKIAKLIPMKDENGKEIVLKKALELVPELKELLDSDEDVKKLFDIALKLEGLHRNSGVHAAGIVIGNKPLPEIVPLYKDPASDMPVTQFNLKYIEDTSLVKFDFLGLKTLTILKQAVALIGKDAEFLSTIPYDDKDTFTLLSFGDTDAVFQFESEGMKDVLRRIKPDKFEDLIAIVSLYRPGPMGNIPSYIARKHGKEEVDCLYPSLEPILSETYGIIIYQEQVMQIAQVMAGYSLGGADLLRRAMGKKIASEMEKQKDIFIDGAVERGVDREKATFIFALMAKFAEYGFNKSHAAAYSWIAYQTAYLKAHYRLEFMCASMNNEKNDTDKLSTFRKDTENAGIKVLPPHINFSEDTFVPEDGAVRYALSAIKGVGENAAIEVVRARKEGGEFKSLSDFLKRIDIKIANRKAIEGMIMAGVFDCFDLNRKKMLYNLDAMMDYSAQILEEKQSNQMSFLGLDKVSSDFELVEIDNKNERNMTNHEKLELEKKVVGFFLSDHPLKSYEKLFKKMRLNRSCDIKEMVRYSPDGVRFKLGVIITKMKKRLNKRNEPFYLITFADMFSEFDVFCFNDVYKTSKEMIESGEPLYIIISGKLNDEGAERLNLHAVEKLSEAGSRASDGILVNLKTKDVIPELIDILNNDDDGKNQIIITVMTKFSDRELKVEIPLKKHYHLSSVTLDKLRSINGIEIEEL